MGLSQDVVQVQGQGPVLPLKAGDAQPPGTADLRVEGAALPDLQVVLQGRVAGEDVFEFHLRACAGQTVQGIEGVGQRWLPMTVTFMLYTSAMASISHRTPLGRALTATQLRAGLPVK